MEIEPLRVPRPTHPGLPPMTYTDLAAPLFRNVVAPDFEYEVRDVIAWRHRWRKFSNWSEGVAHLLLGVASILAFSAGFFDNKYLTFASACSSTACLALLRFSAYANNESAERNTSLTRLLSAAGLPAISRHDPEAAAVNGLDAGSEVGFEPPVGSRRNAETAPLLAKRGAATPPP